jgi:hypothetical protein
VESIYFGAIRNAAAINEDAHLPLQALRTSRD